MRLADASRALAPRWTRRADVQLVVACALTTLLGGALQLHKLASLDAAGREFAETSTAAKVSFLLPFALAKSCANLVVGAVADRADGDASSSRDGASRSRRRRWE